MGGTLLPFGPADETPGVWDTLVLEGIEIAGLATVEIHREMKKDKKASKASSGAEIVFSGVEQAKVGIKIRFWTRDQYDAIVANLLPMVEPDPTKKAPSVLSINHPVSTARKVAAIIVEKVSGPSKLGDGTWEVNLEALEQRPPKPSPAGTFTGSGNAKSHPSECAEIQLKAGDAALRLGQTYVKENQLLSTIPAGVGSSQQTAGVGNAGVTSAGVGSGQQTAGVGNNTSQLADVRAERATILNELSYLRTQQELLGCAEKTPSSDPATSQPQ